MNIIKIKLHRLHFRCELDILDFDFISYSYFVVLLYILINYLS